MKSLIKKILVVVSILIALVLAAAIAIPVFMKEKVFQTVSQEVNKRIEADFSFEDLDLSLFRNFPSLTVSVKGVAIKNRAPFEGIELFSSKVTGVTLNIWSLFSSSGNYEIEKIFVEEPRVHVLVLSDGQANYDIYQGDTSATPADTGAFSLKLKEYTISDAHVIYQDNSLGVQADIAGLTHSGKGDFTAEVFDLATLTRADSITLDYGNVRYLKQANGKFDINVNVDQGQGKYTLKDNELRLNELQLKADGWIILHPDSYDMELAFSSPQNSFKNLFSIIPNAYTRDYADVKATGKFTLNGSVKGTYREQPESLPAFSLHSEISDGSVKYPSLPLGLSAINTSVTVNSPGSNLDQLEIDIPRFSLNVGSDPVSGKLHVHTPVTDPDVDLSLKAKLDLANISKAVPLEKGSQLSGLTDIDAFVKTRYSYIEKKQVDKIVMGGKAHVSQMRYTSPGYPAMLIRDMQASLSRGNLEISNYDIQAGKSDLRGDARIENVLAYFSPSKTMRGKVRLSSKYFNTDEWMAGSTDSRTETAQLQSNGATETFNRYALDVDASLQQVVYGSYDIRDIKFAGSLTPSDLDIRNYSLRIGDSDFSGRGYLNNVSNYVYNNEQLNGEIWLHSNRLNTNQFMSSSTADTAQTTPGIYLVPANLNVQVHATANQVEYTNLQISNLKGTLAVQDRTAMIQDMSGNTLGGKVVFSGGYMTKDEKQPVFNVKTSLQNIAFRDAFEKFNTVKKLAPIAQFISGKFNLNLSSNGKLTAGMTPDLATLNADGLVETIQGAISNIKPLQQLSSQLNISQLAGLDLKDTKNWFTIENGKVTVKEFDRKIKDIQLKISGTHSITQEMDYKIKMRVPRKLLESNAVGAAAGSFVKNIGTELGKLGVKNALSSEFVNLLVNLGGELNKPKVKIQVVGAEGESTLQETVKAQAEAVAKKAKDSLEKLAQSKLEEGKARLEAEKKRMMDSLERVAKQKLDEAAQQAKKAAEEKIGKEIKEKAGEEIEKKAGDKAKQEIDKLKEKTKDFNPFKKKQNPPKDSSGS